jgi:hypothetical protein
VARTGPDRGHGARTPCALLLGRLAGSWPPGSRTGKERSPRHPATDGSLAALLPAQPGRLRIDFDYPFRSGTLRVWVDDELALEEDLAGQARKKALVFRSHSGSFSEDLEVAPGLHEVRVEVRWEDKVKRERIIGRFRSGTPLRLEASLGRIRRDLNLEWK